MFSEADFCRGVAPALLEFTSRKEDPTSLCKYPREFTVL